LIAKRKAIGPIELCVILRRVKHWFVEQVWVAPNQKALVSTIRVFTANLQVMKHALEYIHRRLRIEEESKVSLLGHLHTCEHKISQVSEFNRNQLMDGWHCLQIIHTNRRILLHFWECQCILESVIRAQLAIMN
jgi:hypothetical protein